MWQTIALCIRKAYLKYKLKKEKLKTRKTELASQADGKDSKKEKSLKRKIFVVNIQIAIAVIIPIISIILAATMLLSMFMFIGNAAGWFVLNTKDALLEAEKEKEKNWAWQQENPSNNTGIMDISGGIYPKDPILKNRAMIRQIFVRTAKDASAAYGFTILPEYLFGIQIRETGGTKLFNATDLNKNTDWLTTRLTYSEPVCGKSASKCSYLLMGKSHFVGGTVANGKDMGDPYTQQLNTSRSLYDESVQYDLSHSINLYKSNGKWRSVGHAVGFFQYELSYAESKVSSFKQFPLQEEFGIDEASLPFASTRPNGFFYAPDIVYSLGWIATGYGMGASYNEIVNSSQFKQLDDRNQAFVRVVMSQKAYGSGNFSSENKACIYELMKLVENGKITHLDEMLDNYSGASKYWNSTTYMCSNMGFNGGVQDYIRTTFGLWTDQPDDRSIWYGVKAACAGKIAWYGMTADIEAAEKEMPQSSSGGRWIDYIGSGKFLPVGDGKYYSQKVQATLFRQSSSTTTFNEGAWGQRTVGSKTMTKAGCGVYSTAFCITNLTGTLVTPSDLLDTGIVTSLALPNNKVIELAKHYGLESYYLTIPSTDKGFEEAVIKELQDAGLVVAVWWGATKKYGEPASYFPWYGGEGHFMVIRGYNNTNNKFRVFTSASGANLVDMETTCTYELDAATVRRYLSSSYATCEVIKLKGGAGSITQNPGGTPGPVMGTFNRTLNNTDGSINGTAVKQLQDSITQELGNPKVGWKLYAKGSFQAGKNGCNKYFKSESQGGMNNLQTLQCTWYAFGRAMEYLNEVKGHNFTRSQLSKFLSGNGGKYYYQNKISNGFAYGSTPRPNSLVCFKYANSSDFSGHIAYVEVVDYNKKTYRMSECGSGKGWGGITHERAFSSNYGDEILQGFIYLDEPLEAAKY